MRTRPLYFVSLLHNHYFLQGLIEVFEKAWFWYQPLRAVWKSPSKRIDFTSATHENPNPVGDSHQMLLVLYDHLWGHILVQCHQINALPGSESCRH